MSPGPFKSLVAAPHDVGLWNLVLSAELPAGWSLTCDELKKPEKDTPGYRLKISAAEPAAAVEGDAAEVKVQVDVGAIYGDLHWVEVHYRTDKGDYALAAIYGLRARVLKRDGHNWADRVTVTHPSADVVASPGKPGIEFNAGKGAAPKHVATVHDTLPDSNYSLKFKDVKIEGGVVRIYLEQSRREGIAPQVPVAAKVEAKLGKLRVGTYRLEVFVNDTLTLVYLVEADVPADTGGE
ncbi:MAG: hypothetical protein IPK87_10710 [Planctomycetes bacterium]|nr:hypothetical protein [Planctomycetota bacterium]